MRTLRSLYWILFLSIAISCQLDRDDLVDIHDRISEPILPETAFDYTDLHLPDYVKENIQLLQHDNSPQNNPLTNEGATLGRVLFYDMNLSLNRTVSCGSCHHQEKGFADRTALSEGFQGEHTSRNAMALGNARYYVRRRFFWDERAETLEDQVLMPFQDPLEMGLHLDSLIHRVRDLPYYPALFESAFGTDEVNANRISMALAQFIRSMVSFRSRYDEGRDQVNSSLVPFPNFSEKENIGKSLFRSSACGGCHVTDGFLSSGPTNNGLESTPTDPGAGKTYGNPILNGSFKTSSLRNIEVTGPYMHDGRIATLEEVIAHYSEGINFHPAMAPQIQTGDGRARKFNFTAEEKAALVAFLKTLTDQHFLSDPKFSDPFPE